MNRASLIADRVRRSVFPAGAGMNRLRHERITDDACRVPRRRGDEPDFDTDARCGY